MPGLSFICDFKEDIKTKESDILQALDSMIHFDHYKKDILVKEKSYVLGCTKYDEYPMSSFENNENLIYLEGKIYDKDYQRLRMELNDLAKIINRPIHEVKEIMSEWLLNTDGDFIIFILNKGTNEITIINDALGRLPLYYYKANEILLVSREVRFIKYLINDIKFDKMAIAQYLLFGYSLGRRTLLENVYRLEPASLIKINVDESYIEIDSLYVFNFDIKKYKDRDIQKNSSELVSLFSKACKDRINSNNKNILALSGGLDSRSVAAALNKNEIQFSGVTRLSFDNRESLDAKIAAQIANALDIGWEEIRINPPKGKDILKLLRMKNGLNCLGLSFIIPFLNKKLKETYGSRITYFTGDGGQLLKPSFSPIRNLKRVDELVNYIIHENHIFLLDKVVKILQISKSEIIEELKKHVLSYPEKDWNQKYVHFLFYDRIVKWAYEGEDRNRFYFWSVTPFYSVHFFDYAINCPEKQKLSYKLYSEFLLRLSPQVTKIKDANYKLPITSRKLPIKLFLLSSYHRLPGELKAAIGKNIFKKWETYNNTSLVIKCIKKQINKCDILHDYLSCAAFKLDNLNKIQIDTLFTITSSIEEYECNTCTIKNYYESDFV